MLIDLPALWAINEKNRIGLVRHLILPASQIDAQLVAYRREGDSGYLLQNGQQELITYVFSKIPKATFTQDEPVIVCKHISIQGASLDLNLGHWVSHQSLPSITSNDVLNSWVGAFRFIEENPSTNVIGFRTPQIGALHAIHAHWSVSRENATIVMPTGTGKTETMLGALISNQCLRVLVIVPTDALRTQIAEKFESLGVLKLPGSDILSPPAHRPIVGTLQAKPRDIDELDAFFSRCNVIVSTSHLISGCNPSLQMRMAELCSHLFIDEAHHAEAPTWKEFRQRFESQLVLQFTATPFREDGQKIDGKLIYVYPLRKAQQEGYFRPIKFRSVNQYNLARGDRAIALAALDELDADTTGKHIVMARVDSTSRAQVIHAVYASLGRYEAVIIHSGIKAKDRDEAKRKLLSGVARVVICVDMLGEGFDLPELKIAAFHDIRKSLAITLQLAGRFTRSRTDLGDPVFIANIAHIDVPEQLRNLYSQDPDWNALLPDISEAVINQEVASQEFFNGFGAFLDEVPLKDLRPAASMVVYKTNCTTWTPQKFKHGFRGLSSRDRLYHSLNVQEKTLIILAATEQEVRWSDVQSIKDMSWELFVAIWDSDLELLYLHGSSINGVYKDLAKALCGDDVELFVAPNIFRCFHGINRLILNNVGLNEFLGRQVRFTARMGSDVESRIGQAARQGASKAVPAGQGFENGSKASVGAAKRGRVWSNLRLRVDSFNEWAKAIGRKLADDQLDPEQILEGTLKPQLIGIVPNKPIMAVEWPDDLYLRPEHGVFFQASSVTEIGIAFVDLGVVPRADSDPVILKVFSDDWECRFRLDLFNTEHGFDFKFVQISGPDLKIRRGQSIGEVADFFTEFAPSVWYADGSCLEGCAYTELPSSDISPYPIGRLTAFDWTGVDITKESQKEAKFSGTVQYQLIRHLESNSSYEIIFDDDGSGEAADVVAIRTDQENGRTFIEVELYHCKYAGGEPGARIDDLYVVCGQAQRSVCWLINHDRRTELFTHLLRRDDQRVSNSRPTRFERGDTSILTRIRDMSRRCDVRLKVWVVQPGLSAAAASNSQLTLLAVTERFLNDTYQVPFNVFCSA